MSSDRAMIARERSGNTAANRGTNVDKTPSRQDDSSGRHATPPPPQTAFRAPHNLRLPQGLLLNDIPGASSRDASSLLRPQQLQAASSSSSPYPSSAHPASSPRPRAHTFADITMQQQKVVVSGAGRSCLKNSSRCVERTSVQTQRPDGTGLQQSAVSSY